VENLHPQQPATIESTPGLGASSELLSTSQLRNDCVSMRLCAFGVALALVRFVELIFAAQNFLHRSEGCFFGSSVMKEVSVELVSKVCFVGLLLRWPEAQFKLQPVCSRGSDLVECLKITSPLNGYLISFSKHIFNAPKVAVDVAHKSLLVALEASHILCPRQALFKMFGQAMYDAFGWKVEKILTEDVHFFAGQGLRLRPLPRYGVRRACQTPHSLTGLTGLMVLFAGKRSRLYFR